MNYDVQISPHYNVNSIPNLDMSFLSAINELSHRTSAAIQHARDLGELDVATELESIHSIIVKAVEMHERKPKTAKIEKPFITVDRLRRYAKRNYKEYGADADIVYYDLDSCGLSFFFMNSGLPSSELSKPPSTARCKWCYRGVPGKSKSGKPHRVGVYSSDREKALRMLESFDEVVCAWAPAIDTNESDAELEYSIDSESIIIRDVSDVENIKIKTAGRKESTIYYDVDTNSLVEFHRPFPMDETKLWYAVRIRKGEYKNLYAHVYGGSSQELYRLIDQITNNPHKDLKQIWGGGMCQ